MAKEERPLYNKFQGKHGRTPGVYLDEVERRQLEDYRATIEGRDPDYEHLDIGYSPIVPLEMVPDNRLNSNPSANLDPQEVAPVVTIEQEVFDEPNVVVRDNVNYVDQLSTVNGARAAGAPAGAPAGMYDDGGKGGPSFLADLGSNQGDKEAEQKQKEREKVAAEAAKSTTTKGTDLSANDSPTMAPENRPRDRGKATKKTAAKKSTAKKTTARKSTAKKTTAKRSR